MAPGTELTFDYSTTMIGGNWSLDACQCGSEICRGRVDDFDTLPPPLQLAYIRRGVVPAFVLRRVEALRATWHRNCLTDGPRGGAVP